MLQHTFSRQAKSCDVGGSDRWPVAPLIWLNKETEDRDSVVRGIAYIGLDVLHEQPPIRIERLRQLKEDRRD